MKILVLSFYYYPDLSAGSFRSTALVAQLKRLKRADLEIDVITTTPNRYSSYQRDAAEIESHAGVTIRRITLPQHGSGMMEQAMAFAHFAAKVRRLVKDEHYALVYATSSRLLAATLGAWVANQQQALLYLDIRDLFADTVGDVFPPLIAKGAKLIFSGIERWTFSKAQHINFVSKGFQSYIQKRYAQHSLSFYTNGIDDAFMDQPLVSQPKSTAPLVILYAGNIGEGQGLDRIIPFLAKQMEGHAIFRIIGDGGRKSQLEEVTRALGCSNVEFAPPMDRDALIHEYHQADVLFLHLNDHAAFRKVLPSKLFEYAAMGKPIWAGVCGYPAEFIQQEISAAAVFYPCDVTQAMAAFAALPLTPEDRVAFKRKYHRAAIMRAMATELLSYC